MFKPPTYYILKDRKIIKVDLWTFAAWYEDHSKRRIKYDELNGFEISTVFLGLDQSFGLQPVPVLFETMIFGPPESDINEMQWRYKTIEGAEHGHNAAVQIVKYYHGKMIKVKLDEYRNYLN